MGPVLCARERLLKPCPAGATLRDAGSSSGNQCGPGTCSAQGPPAPPEATLLCVCQSPNLGNSKATQQSRFPKH